MLYISYNIISSREEYSKSTLFTQSLHSLFSSLEVNIIVFKWTYWLRRITQLRLFPRSPFLAGIKRISSNQSIKHILSLIGKIHRKSRLNYASTMNWIENVDLAINVPLLMARVNSKSKKIRRLSSGTSHAISTICWVIAPMDSNASISTPKRSVDYLNTWISREIYAIRRN